MRVVIVEDNSLVRQLEAEALTDLGYEVATAANAEEALQLLNAESVAILITDLRLPGAMHGAALARTARQYSPDLVVMLVGADIGKLALPDLEGIADAVLGKPFMVAEFERRVTTLARLAEARAAIRGTPSDEPNADPVAPKEATISDRLAQIKRWRLKAEELRTVAEQFVVQPSIGAVVVSSPPHPLHHLARLRRSLVTMKLAGETCCPRGFYITLRWHGGWTAAAGELSGV